MVSSLSYMKKSRVDKLLNKFPFATRDWLWGLYVVNESSLPEIYKHHGIDYRATKDLLTHYNIPVRSISQSRLTKRGKEKIISGFLKKYGVENPSQLAEIKEKKKKTFLSNYGVDNIWKSAQYYDWLDEYMLAKYGVKRFCENPWGWKGKGVEKKDERIKKLWSGRMEWWESLSDDEKSKIASKMRLGNKQTSKLETRFAQTLSRLRVSYQPHAIVCEKNFDFKINKTNILVEINGDFWHANPNKYNKTDLLDMPGGKIKAGDLWEKDKNKTKLAEACGHKVLVLWENEMRTMSDKDLDIWVLDNIVSNI